MAMRFNRNQRKIVKILEDKNTTGGSCAYPHQAYNGRRFEIDYGRFRRIFSADANFYCFQTSLIQKFTTGRLAPWNQHCYYAINGSKRKLRGNPENGHPMAEKQPGCV